METYVTARYTSPYFKCRAIPDGVEATVRDDRKEVTFTLDLEQAKYCEKALTKGSVVFLDVEGNYGVLPVRINIENLREALTTPVYTVDGEQVDIEKYVKQLPAALVDEVRTGVSCLTPGKVLTISGAKAITRVR